MSTGQFLSIKELESHPEFKKLTFNEQRHIRQGWAEENLPRLPEFSALKPQERVMAYDEIVNGTPVFENENDLNVIRFKHLATRIGAGDPDAQREAMQRIMLVESTRSSIVGNMIAGVASAFDEDKNYAAIYGRDGRKINEMLMRSLQSAPNADKKALLDLEANANTAAVVIGMAEAVITSMTLVGSLGKAGVLTKNLLGPTGKIAKFAGGIKSSLGSRLVGELGEQAVQSVLTSVISTAENTALYLFQNPNSKAALTDIAKSLGNEVIFDWVAWAAFTPAIVGMKAIYRSLVGFGRANSKVVKEWAEMNPDQFREEFTDFMFSGKLKKGHLEGLRMRAPESYKMVMEDLNRYRVTVEAIRNGIDTPEARAKAVAGTAGFSLIENADKKVWELRPFIGDATEVKDFADLDSAWRWAVQNANATVVNYDEARQFATGFSPKMTLQKQFQVKMPVDTIYDPKQLEQIIRPKVGKARTEDVKWFITNMAASTGTVFDAKDVQKYIKNISFIESNDAFLKANVETDYLAKRVILPSDISTPEMERAYRKYIFDYAKKLADDVGGPEAVSLVGKRAAEIEEIARSAPLRRSGSLIALETVVKSQLGTDIKFKGSTIVIGGQSFDTIDKATRFVYRSLLEQGKLSLDDVTGLIADVSGLRLKPFKRGEVEMFALYRGNKEIQEAASIQELLDTSPELSAAFSFAAFPSYLGPSTWVVSAESGQALVKDGIAIGSTENLLEMSSAFMKSPKSATGKAKVLTADSRGTITYDIQKTVYTVFDPDTGIERELGTAAAAKAELKRIKEFTQDIFMSEMTMRGFYTKVGPDGVMRAYDSTGAATDIRSKADAEKFLQAHQLPDGPIDLLGNGMTANLDIHKDNIAVVDELNRMGKAREIYTKIVRNETIGMALFPVETALEDFATKTGNASLLKSYRSLLTNFQLVNSLNQKFRPAIDGIFKDIHPKHYDDISLALTVPKTAPVWQKLTPQVRDAVGKIQAFYEEFNKSYGIADGKGLNYYAPRVMKPLHEMIAAGQEPPTMALDYLRLVYGDQIPKELELRAAHLRTAVLADAMTDKNPYRAMLVYINEAHKSKFIGDAVGQVKKIFQEFSNSKATGKEASVMAHHLRDSIMEMFGATTTMGKQVKNASYKATKFIYDKFLSKLGETAPFKEVDFSKFVTDDLIGKLNSYFTISTQAGRMWAIPRNLTQTTLLGVVVGQPRAWGAIQYVVDHPEYVNDLISRGWFSDSLYKGHDLSKSPIKNWLELSLNPLENSDMITRAICAKVAEDLIEEKSQRLAKGIITKSQFLKEINADILDKTLQTELLDLVSMGRFDGAKELFGKKLSDLTMFNYMKGTQGAAFRGVIGRLFGKLGVYPVGALNLYRDMLTRGDPARIIARTASLVATSTAIYTAFQTVGINYTGFLWSDPFEFSGGPYWIMLNDALQSLGGNQDSAMARARLKNSAIRTAIPTVFRHTADAARYFSEGRWYEGMLAMASSPMSKELREWGYIDSPFDR